MKRQIRTRFTLLTRIVLLVCLLLRCIPSLQAQELEWVGGWGGTFTIESKAITVDKDKDVICVGQFRETVDFNPGSGVFNLTSAGGDDVYVLKMDADGHFKWAFRIGNVYGDMVNDVTTDDAGNIYIIGTFSHTAVDFDPGTGTQSLTPQNLDIYIAKYDKDGNYLHAIRIGSSAVDNGMGIAVDAQGYIYHTGNFSGTADFDPGAGTFNMTSAGSGSQDIYISKLDPGFNLVWAKKMGGSFTGEIGRSVKLDGKGHLYFTGSFAGSVNFDPNGGTYTVSPNSTKPANSDGFVSKFDTAGNHVWTKNIGGNNDNPDVAHSVAVDTAGNLYVVGYSRDTVYFGPRASAVFSYRSTGGTDGYLAKLDPAGNFLWINHIAGTGSEEVVAVQVDSGGGVYIAGYFENSVDLDPDPVGTKVVAGVGNSRDIFVCKYDTDGKYIWGHSMGNVDSDVANDLVIDEYGTMYVTGKFHRVVDFNPGTSKDELTAMVDYGSVFALKLRTGCTVHKEFKEVACDSFMFNGKRYRETGIYKDTFARSTPSCDSITILNLVVNKSVNNPVVDGYYCDSVAFNGVVYKTTGQFTQHYQTVHGCDSTIQYDLIIGNSNAQALTVNACDSFSLNDTLVYKSSGIHVVTFANASGCDSTVILNLTIHTVLEASFTQNGNVLKATEGDEWQWIDCATGEAIDGATDQEYEVHANGRYAVVVGVDGVCADTSSCREVVLEENKIVGIDQAEFVHLYPNPASVTITLSSGEDLQGSEIRIVSMAGQVLDVVRPGKGHAVVLHVGDLARGIYFAEILQEGRNVKRVKFVKE